MNNSKHIVLKIATIICLLILLNGCLNDLFNQSDNTFTGQDQVEFKPVTNTVDARSSKNSSPVEVSPLLQLISSKGTLDSDISIQFVVDDSSTAVAGTDYTIASSSPLTIAFGKVSTHLNIEVTADELNDGETQTLYISQKNISGADVIPAVNYKTYTLIIRGK